ncbi:4096_t:CDS:10 [Ambispora gerdemannii]|uniref:4096_t:CDS:1 n=1 Tax=Ambispora gerdemannii TaxID=144530 RepID=A0A9N9FXS1_9GLOM|nr:4096_t:CDS:10 [Ambispora gerdemannii]
MTNQQPDFFIPSPRGEILRRPFNRARGDAGIVDAVAHAAYNEKKWVWVKDKTEGYISGYITNDLNDSQIEVQLNDDTTRIVDVNETEKMNPPKFDKVEDMADLTHLNEASVIHNLRQRYYSNLIYTYSGLFLVAINPYHKLPIYSEQVINSYKHKRRSEMSPHIYAISDAAYNDMLRHRENQSLLITGESGAGKTENTKKVIQYITSIASDVSNKEQFGRLEQQILQANPILEAFGNAQTIRNNNSSRFGKFIRIEFNSAGYIAGANIERYLLEKSRITHQTENERNYHIFYQLMKGAPNEIKEKFYLDGTLNDYNYTRSSKKDIDGVDDVQEFNELVKAMNIVGLEKEEQDDLFRIVAAVMHLGNIVVTSDRDEQAQIQSTPLVGKVCGILGIKVTDFLKGLLTPKVKAGREWVLQARNKQQVLYSIDALAKALYERSFRALVDRINSAIDHPSNKSTFIGVLDIAGFEIFKTNSFEQLLINYTNEKLQQFFNHHMFILEQEEYKMENIDWKFIDFGLDLQLTIDLIEKSNPVGILSCIDEECVMPKASDKTFIQKLDQIWRDKSPKYETSRFQQGFILHHYAGKVEYRTLGWLDKNKDPINENVVSLLAHSSEPYVSSLFTDYFVAGNHNILQSPENHKHYNANINNNGNINNSNGYNNYDNNNYINNSNNYHTPIKRRNTKSGIFRTVSQRHKEQLHYLMQQLHATQPHFVRCILPNEEKKAFKINVPLVLAQLRCNGVLEGIRICRAGFPNRLQFKEFRQRYEILLSRLIEDNNNNVPMDDHELTKKMLSEYNFDETQFRIGNSKVFFRAGVLAELEEIRDAKLSQIFTGLQAHCRGLLARPAKEKEHYDEIELVNENLRKEVEELKAKLESEVNAKHEEMANRNRIESEFEELQIKYETEIIKSSKYAQSLNSYKSKTDGTIAKLENFELERLKAEKNEEYLKVHIKELEAALSDAINDRKSAEEKIKTLEEEIVEMESKMDDEAMEMADLSLIKRRLQEDIDEERDRYKKDLEEREFALEQTRKKYHKELTRLTNEIELERANSIRLHKENKDLLSENEEIRIQIEDISSSSLVNWKREREKYEAKITELSQLYNETKIGQDELQMQLDNLRVALDDSESQKFLLEKQKRNLEERLEDIDEQYHSENQNKQAAENSINVLDTELNELRQLLEEYQDKEIILNEKLRKSELNATEAQTELAKEREDNQDLIKSKIALEKQIKELNIKSLELETKSITSPRGIKRLEQRLEEINTQLETETREKNEAHRQLRKNDRTIRELQYQLSERDKSKTRLEEEICKYEQKVSRMRQAIEELQNSESSLQLSKRRIEREANEARERSLSESILPFLITIHPTFPLNTAQIMKSTNTITNDSDITKRTSNNSLPNNVPNTRSTSSFSENTNKLAASLISPKRAKLPPVEVFRRLVALSDGRDKTLKIIQYSAKLYLWAFLSPSSVLLKYRISTSTFLKPRLSALTSNFSTTRKILRLAHFIEPYNELRDYITGDYKYPVDKIEILIYYIGFLNSIVGLLNDFFDDLYCLGKIGVLSKTIEKRAEPIAIRFWFFTILLDVNDCLLKVWLLNAKMRKVKDRCNEEEWKKLEEKKYWLKYNLVKFLMDLGFCGYDFFGLAFSDGWQAITGLIAGILSFHKLWIRLESRNSA